MFLSIVAVVLFILATPTKTEANNRDINTTHLFSKDKRTIISEHLYILEDKNKDLSIEDVTNDAVSKQFKRNKKGIPNYGYTDSAYWTYFKIKNDTVHVERLL